MYDYRHMTGEERKAIVEYRKGRGFPLHKPPHIRQGEGWYFVTAATFEHKGHFGSPRELTALEHRILEAFALSEIDCAGWVVMPNHYHALVHAGGPAEVGKALGPVHGRSGQYANRRDNTPGRKVWYKWSDRKVRSDGHFWACLHYTVYNPVKHGYARTIEDWPWSCFHELLRERGEAWMDDLARAYPLDDFGKGWDWQ